MENCRVCLFRKKMKEVINDFKDLKTYDILDKLKYMQCSEDKTIINHDDIDNAKCNKCNKLCIKRYYIDDDGSNIFHYLCMPCKNYMYI